LSLKDLLLDLQHRETQKQRDRQTDRDELHELHQKCFQLLLADAFSFAGRLALSTVVGFLSFLQELEQRELSLLRMVVAAMCGWGRNRMAEFRSWRKEDLHWQQERRCRWWRKKDGEDASGVALAALSMLMESAAARLAIVAVFSGVRVQEAILLPLWRSSPSTAPMETTSMT
jgi:hypothetical protein